MLNYVETATYRFMRSACFAAIPVGCTAFWIAWPTKHDFGWYKVGLAGLLVFAITGYALAHNVLRKQAQTFEPRHPLYDQDKDN